MTKLYNKNEYKIIRKNLRNNSTEAEKMLWRKLKAKQFYGYRFRRQFGIENYIVDFYCPALRLVVEIDGGTHARSSEIEKDKTRQRFLESLGNRFLRFNNSDIYDNLNEALIVLHRKCEELSAIRKKDLPLSPSLARKGGLGE